MEKTTLDALGWKLSASMSQPSTSLRQLIPDLADDLLTPLGPTAGMNPSITVKRRFQFSSSLKRMSTISKVEISGKDRVLISVKGAPETLKSMFVDVPEEYESTYKWYAQRGSRVLALGYKYADGMRQAQVRFRPSVVYCD